MSEQYGNEGDDAFVVQAAYLVVKQHEISIRLFEKGVTSRIIKAASGHSSLAASLEGTPEYTETFVPTIHTRKRDGTNIRIISLVTDISNPEGRQADWQCAVLPVCEIGPTGIIETNGVSLADAETVIGAAQEIEALRATALPDLRENLLSVVSPFPSYPVE